MEKGLPVLDEREKEFQAIIKSIIMFGMSGEMVFVVQEQFYKGMILPVIEDYKKRNATAKLATYDTFEKDSYVESFQYLGNVIHFKIIK